MSRKTEAPKNRRDLEMEFLGTKIPNAKPIEYAQDLSKKGFISHKVLFFSFPSETLAIKKFGNVKDSRMISADSYFYFIILSEKALPKIPKQIEKYIVHVSHLEFIR